MVKRIKGSEVKTNQVQPWCKRPMHPLRDIIALLKTMHTSWLRLRGNKGQDGKDSRIPKYRVEAKKSCLWSNAKAVPGQWVARKRRWFQLVFMFFRPVWRELTYRMMNDIRKLYLKTVYLGYLAISRSKIALYFWTRLSRDWLNVSVGNRGNKMSSSQNQKLSTQGKSAINPLE